MELLYTAHVPAGPGPFPTVLALHGWGASAHDLIGLAPVLHGGEALVLCPQGPTTLDLGQGFTGYGWFPLAEGGPLDPFEFRKGAAALRSFLEQALERYPVDRRKLVALGFSQGGVMAYDLVLREPALFAGLAALSSWLPPGLVASIARQPEHEGLPVLVQHGSEDPMIPVARAQESRDALRGLGVNLAYREYEMGHEVRPDSSLRDLLQWLEEKVFQPIQLV
jgi:phospholipase/carboxylesterase